MKTKLIQLGCGDWVDPSEVVSLVVWDKTEEHDPRVVIALRNGDRLVDRYSTIEAARFARTCLAQAINSNTP